MEDWRPLGDFHPISSHTRCESETGSLLLVSDWPAFSIVIRGGLSYFLLFKIFVLIYIISQLKHVVFGKVILIFFVPFSIFF